MPWRTHGQHGAGIDLVDAHHPQTMLAYSMNGKDLPVAHGAPLRLRVERPLGDKQAKSLMRIEVVDAHSGLWGGRGGFWEDRGDEWYARASDMSRWLLCLPLDQFVHRRRPRPRSTSVSRCVKPSERCRRRSHALCQ